MLLNHHPELIDQNLTTTSEEDIIEDEDELPTSLIEDEEGDLPGLGSQVEEANDESVTNSLLDLNN